MVQITKLLAFISSIDPSGHFYYISIYDHFYQLNVEYFVVEIHHGDFLYFYFTSKVAAKITSHDTPC